MTRPGIPRGRILLIVSVATYAGVVLWRLGAAEPEGAFGPASVYARQPAGLSQAFAYLAARRGDDAVRVLHRRIDAGELPANAVVFQAWNGAAWLDESLRRASERLDEAADEDEDGADDEADDEAGDAAGEESDTAGGERPPATPFVSAREAEWVREGGRLVVLTDQGYPGLEIVDAAAASRPRKVFPLWPAVEELAPPVLRVLAGPGLDGTHAVFVAGDRPFLVRLPLGRGEVFLLGAPEMLTNAHLDAADHLALLEALAGEGRPVYFDETAHGSDQGAGLFHLLRGWRLLPALGLLIAAAVVAGWRRSRRLGPAEDPHRELRTESVDMVDSLARLYTRALRRRDLLALYRREVADAVARHGGGAALPEPLPEPLPDGPGDVDDTAFRHQLEALNHLLRRTEDEEHRRSRHRVA